MWWEVADLNLSAVQNPPEITFGFCASLTSILVQCSNLELLWISLQQLQNLNKLFYLYLLIKQLLENDIISEHNLLVL